MSARALLHPAAIACVAVLVANDHWLKHAWPGFVTGKLSDVAGLAFFPLVLAGLWEEVTRRRSPGTVPGCAVVTAAVFAAINVHPLAAEAYRVGLGALQWPAYALSALATGSSLPALHRAALTLDPTDLVALPAVLVAVALARSEPRRAGYCTRPARGS